MALQVWLPFNGDLTNNGLSATAITPSASSLTYGTGKTCPSAWNSSSAWLKIPYEYADTNEMSICFWVKPNGPVDLADVFSFGSGANRLEKTNTTNYSWCSSSGSALLASGTVPFAMENAIWYHVAIVADGSNVRFYLNGTIKKAVAQTATLEAVFGDSTDFLISARTTGGGNRYYSFINDFRIYDNAISTKEVKLLSQGLVAHYQLKGMGRTNYLKGAGKYTKDHPLVRNSNDSSAMNDSYVYYDTSDLSVTVPADGTYTWVLESDGTPTGHPTFGTVATSRYFSMWLQNVSTGTHYLWQNQGTGVGGERYGSVTIPAGTYKVRTNLYAADGVNYQVKFWNMKVVQGAYDPSDTWCPHEEDELYTAMRYDAALCTDCSGYGNTLTQVGTIPVCGNSIRYGSCIDFNQTGYLKKDDFNIVTDKFTISFWVNTPPTTNAQHFLFGTHNNWTGNGFSAWRSANSASYSTIVKSNSASSHAGISFFHDADTWNHIAYVYTGTEFIYYKNGAEQSRITYGSGGTVSHPVLYLGNSLYSNASNSEIDEASMSDFRFYVSALSDSDIADLYKNSASLSKDGTLFAYEFNENKQNTINKDGIVSTGGFNDKAVPTYDMKIKALDDGSTWARIHHLDVSNDKTFFANASEVAKCVNKNNRYSRMGIVDRYKAGGEYEFMLTYPSMKKTVPAGYTQLEYIQATGTQFIRTGVYGYADGSYIRGHRWEFDIEFENNGARQLMGYGPNGGEYWGLQTSGYYGVGGNTAVSAWSGRDTIVHDYSGGTAGGNTLWANNATSNVGSNLTTSQEYTLFNLKWGGDTGYWCYAKLYRCKCIQGTTLIRDFVPAMRNSDGVIGLFDVVNNVFYTNAGSGSFLCNYSYLNYIEGTGVQYINTGIAENAVYGIEMKCLVTGLAVNWQSLLSGTLDNFTIGSVDANKNAFYLRLRTTEICRPSEMYSDKINTISIKNGLVHLNGSLVGTYTHGALSTATGALYVFANNAPSRYSKMRLYGLKIYDANGNVSRDYVPCNYGGSIGLFDNVTQAFYGNAGTGAFMYGGSKGKYQWLDYVESSGTQYINTGFAPTSNSRIVIRASSSGPYSVYGMTGDGTSFNLTGNDNGMYYYWGGQAASTVSNWFNQVHTFEQNKNVSYIDGSAYYTHSATTWSTSLPIFLFARNASGSMNDAGGTIRIYSCQLYENGTLVRDYVPCVSPSGKVGLYDKVTKRFFGNSGTGSLVAGPAKESIPLYNRWTQTSLTSDVNQGDNISFKPIFSSWPQHLGPLKPAQAVETTYDCDIKGTATWYSPIGQYVIWNGGIPAADSSIQLETELWVRTDRFADEDQFNIYDGSITATDYIEI